MSGQEFQDRNFRPGMSGQASRHFYFLFMPYLFYLRRLNFSFHSVLPFFQLIVLFSCFCGCCKPQLEDPIPKAGHCQQANKSCPNTNDTGTHPHHNINIAIALPCSQSSTSCNNYSKTESSSGKDTNTTITRFIQIKKCPPVNLVIKVSPPLKPIGIVSLIPIFLALTMPL